MKGFYEPYPACMELLESSIFCSLKHFLAFINRLEHNILCIEDEIKFLQRNCLDGNYTFAKTPLFNRDNRFFDDFYVYTHNAKFKTLLQQFLKALHLLNVLIQRGVDSKSAYVYECIDNLTDAKQSYDAAFRNLADICNSTDIEQLKEHGIYCRETFEEKYGLTWVDVADN